MKNFRPMPEPRKAQLMKAASSVIDMIAMSVDPDAALRKVALAEQMNGNEIDLVSHAVNNAVGYDHIHTADEEARGEPFALTNAETVKSELYPDKQQEVPDVVEKMAGFRRKDDFASYLINDSWLAPDTTSDHEQVWKTAMAPAEVADRPRFTRDPYAFADKAQDVIDDLQMKVASAEDGVMSLLDEISRELSYINAPSYAMFKAAAVADGVSGETLSLLDRTLGRADQPAASYTYTAKIASLVSTAQFIDRLVDAAAVFEQERAALETQTQEKVAQTMASQLGQFISVTPELATGGTQEQLQQTLLGALGGDRQAEDAPDLDVSRFIEQSRTRELLNDVRSDRYLSGYSLPDIQDAFNSGVSAGFGDSRPKLVSYMRQFLASDGNVPLDIMLKAKRGE